MLCLLILFLLLQVSAATSEDTEENSSGSFGLSDDEDDYHTDVKSRLFHDVAAARPGASPGSDRSTGDENAGGATLIIIIVAVSVSILAIGGVVAIVLYRRHLQGREQGVYSVPAEQGQKAAV